MAETDDIIVIEKEGNNKFSATYKAIEKGHIKSIKQIHMNMNTLLQFVMKHLSKENKEIIIKEPTLKCGEVFHAAYSEIEE